MRQLEYAERIAALRDRLDRTARIDFEETLRLGTMSPQVTLGLTCFLWFTGIDRFRLGLWGTGLLKLAIGVPVMGLAIASDIRAEPSVSLVSALGSLVQILFFLDGLVTPGLTGRRNLARLTDRFGGQPPA